jgi:hypothetical protein
MIRGERFVYSYSGQIGGGSEEIECGGLFGDGVLTRVGEVVDWPTRRTTPSNQPPDFFSTGGVDGTVRFKKLHRERHPARVNRK